MAFKRKVINSPAASLLPQIQESLERNKRVRRRIIDTDEPDESHGKFSMYFSAGGLELPDDRRDGRRFYVARSPRLAIFIAVCLIVIYFAFG